MSGVGGNGFYPSNYDQPNNRSTPQSSSPAQQLPPGEIALEPDAQARIAERDRHQVMRNSSAVPVTQRHGAAPPIPPGSRLIALSRQDVHIINTFGRRLHFISPADIPYEALSENALIWVRNHSALANHPSGREIQRLAVIALINKRNPAEADILHHVITNHQSASPEKIPYGTLSEDALIVIQNTPALANDPHGQQIQSHAKNKLDMRRLGRQLATVRLQQPSEPANSTTATSLTIQERIAAIENGTATDDMLYGEPAYKQAPRDPFFGR